MLGVLLLTVSGCSARHRPMIAGGRAMEGYAEERYAQAVFYMEASRFELAKQQFAIAEKTAVSPELRQLAHEGYDKAAGVIAAKR
jgi:hypothetical protein